MRWFLAGSNQEATSVIDASTPPAPGDAKESPIQKIQWTFREDDCKSKVDVNYTDGTKASTEVSLGQLFGKKEWSHQIICRIIQRWKFLLGIIRSHFAVLSGNIKRAMTQKTWKCFDPVMPQLGNDVKVEGHSITDTIVLG